MIRSFRKSNCKSSAQMALKSSVSKRQLFKPVTITISIPVMPLPRTVKNGGKILPEAKTKMNYSIFKANLSLNPQAAPAGKVTAAISQNSKPRLPPSVSIQTIYSLSMKLIFSSIASSPGINTIRCWLNSLILMTKDKRKPKSSPLIPIKPRRKPSSIAA